MENPQPGSLKKAGVEEFRGTDGVGKSPRPRLTTSLADPHIAAAYVVGSPTPLM